MLHDRKLSPLEQAVEVLNRRASSSNVITICRITGPLSEKIVRQALDLIQCCHPRRCSEYLIILVKGSVQADLTSTRNLGR